MSGWWDVLHALSRQPGLSADERAAVERCLAGARECEVARLRLSMAASDAAGALRDFSAAWAAGDAALSLDEAEQVAQHPDLAELNVMLDGYYGEPAE